MWVAKEKTTISCGLIKKGVDTLEKYTYNEGNFRGNWRKESTAGGENSGESRKGAEGARFEKTESLRQKDGDIRKV